MTYTHYNQETPHFDTDADRPVLRLVSKDEGMEIVPTPDTFLDKVKLVGGAFVAMAKVAVGLDYENDKPTKVS